ncbi:MAG TPA: hypothetical protein DCM59_01815 [Clostridium sp.]|nr:hypothetical protein [Clostridium sp.]
MKCVVKKHELDRLLEVTYAVGKDETRPTLLGVCIRKNKFAAVDGKRISIRKSTSIEGIQEILMPMSVIRAYKGLKLSGNTDIEIIDDGEYVGFLIEDLLIQDKYLTGNFIDYESLIPKKFDTRIAMKGENLLKGLKTFNKTKMIDLIVTEETLTIRALINDEEHNLGINLLSCEGLRREEFTIRVNPKLLIEATKNYKYITQFEFTSPLNPMVISDGSYSGNLDMLLPIRVVNKDE